MSKIWTTISDAVIAANKAILATTGIQLRDNTEWLKARVDVLPSTAWSGLKLTAGIDTDHDITVATGAARDTTDVDALVLGAAQTKQLDARWASGDAAGGLANAPLFANQVTVSFDNATSKILGTGLFGGAGAGDTIIVVGSTSNDGVWEVTAATANDATLSVAPTTEGAGSSITVYIIKANWLYNVFIADDGAGGAEIGFDDSLTAVNFLGLAGVGTLYRAIGYIETNGSANIGNIVWIGDGHRVQYITATQIWFRPAMLAYLEEEAVGGGGGGGGDNTSQGAGGGAAGTWGFRRDKAADLPASLTITIGAGGPGKSGTGTATAGGTTSIGSQMSCPGGPGGVGNGAGGALASDATGAQFSIRGQNGEGLAYGLGGSGPFGHGGRRIAGQSGPGSNGSGYGAGGSGGDGGTATKGGDGSGGLAKLTEYYA